ncbi:MAG: hypothetical protein KME28_07665 [Pelatocladus maniniholoensis HA4357-MV3]|uniref:Uncharacterized protein n=1 Tax=Pelatocladus maniniholoensis HA4357-MV3 TaxID=1117104 RepID=A0A9E3LT43_9NOST|nr:hypothetical protein [Pelatocladus maniniholoensis HA4357-MV3]
MDSNIQLLGKQLRLSTVKTIGCLDLQYIILPNMRSQLHRFHVRIQ